MLVPLEELEFKQYRKLPDVVHAAVITEDRAIRSQAGLTFAKRGNILIVGEDGIAQCVMTQEGFAKRYEPIEEVEEDALPSRKSLAG